MTGKWDEGDDESRSRWKGKEIPDKAKWEIAAGVAAALPVMYDSLFRDVVGEDYDGMEQDLWIELAKEGVKVARTYGMPARNATEIASTFTEILTIFFGPRPGLEFIGLSEKSGVILLKSCPFAAKAREYGAGREALFHKCLAFSVVAIQHLNPHYSLRFVRSGCMGDRTCELKIGLREEIEREIAP